MTEIMNGSSVTATDILPDYVTSTDIVSIYTLVTTFNVTGNVQVTPVLGTTLTVFRSNWSMSAKSSVGGSELKRLAQVLVISLLALLCTAGNLLLIVTIHHCMELRNISNILIINLASIGLLVAILVLPAWGATTWSQTPAFGDVICSASAMIMLLLFLEAMSTLAGVAIDRYGSICYPLKYPPLVSNTKAFIFILYTWIQSLVLASLPLFGFGRYEFGISEVPICTVNFGHDVSFSLLVCFVVVVPACVIICACYWRIFSVARSQARRVHNMEASIAQSLAAQNGVQPADLPSPRPRHTLWQIAARSVKNSVKQTRAFRTVFTIIGCFFACWTPYIVFIFYSMFSQHKPGYVLEFIVTLLALANYIANPAICVFMNKDFRKGAKKVFGLHRKELLQGVVSAWMAATIRVESRGRKASHTSKVVPPTAR